MLPLPELVGHLAAAASSLVAAFTRRPALFSLDKMRESHQPAWTCSSERACRELGWTWTPQYPLAKGMRDAVEWFRAQPVS